MRLIADIAGERLDAFLARCADGLSRSAAQKLLESGAVLRNGKPGKKNDKLSIGDQVEYTIPEAKPVDITPTPMDLEIVYEDDDLLVINKPKGWWSILPQATATIPWLTACFTPWATT